jgi:hypothetical protein
MVAGDETPRCPGCGATNAEKLVSRFARYRNEDDRLEAVADQLESMGDPDSPAAMQNLVREVGKAMDEDMSGELEEMFDADMSGPD